MHRIFSIMLLLTIAAGQRTPTAYAEVNHVIHISVDGLRGDLLENLINSSPSDYSNFKRFVDEGASTFNARTDYSYTSTIPNHTAMLTGRPVLQPAGLPNTTHHGYTVNTNPGAGVTLHNSGNPNLSYIASSFDVAHDSGLSTALFTGKSKFVLFEQSYSDAGAPDTTGADNGTDKIDTYTWIQNKSDLQTEILLDLAASEYDYSFLHYRDPDSTGHNLGWGSSDWNETVKGVDGYLEGIFDLVESDPGLLNETAIILTADHGGGGGGVATSHTNKLSPENYTIPLFVWGPGVAQGADLYDLNSGNRLEPGTGRPDYTAAGQPIRNGGTGNLALSLLGLGPIPGSLINQGQDLVVGVPEPASAGLVISGLLVLAASRRRRIA